MNIDNVQLWFARNTITKDIVTINEVDKNKENIYKKINKMISDRIRKMRYKK